MSGYEIKQKENQMKIEALVNVELGQLEIEKGEVLEVLRAIGGKRGTKYVRDFVEEDLYYQPAYFEVLRKDRSLAIDIDAVLLTSCFKVI